ncbi:hypothetical protein ElyMa_005875300 [Elysia marginata]|uniref:Uncharacterized protein n=1 Tax=Elysia marginata TaxID=1093978 RepID=A0AAV4G1N6_9GAST|nr:hypothetical protein ElyMa_005875300 [Elysia marginata]
MKPKAVQLKFAYHRRDNHISADIREDNESDEEVEEKTTRNTSAEARAALTTLKKFISEQGTEDLRNAIWSIEFKFEKLIVKKAKQTTINARPFQEVSNKGNS